MRQEVEAEIRAKHDKHGIPDSDRDEAKFLEAAERRKERRSEALKERRNIRENRSHVYALTQIIGIPSPPFGLQQQLAGLDAVFSGGGGGFGVASVATPAFQHNRPFRSLRILYLVEQGGSGNNAKADALQNAGHTLLAPALPDNDFDASIRSAEEAVNAFRPDIIVGDQRGGAVAINMNSGDLPLVLLRPAWKRFGTATTTKPFTLILHSPADRVTPILDSEELRINSGLPNGMVIPVGNARLDDPDSLSVLKRACQGLAG
ncbi:MAG: hypothetical protein ACR2NZ_17340 [Rubripirellula sp.]